MENKYLSLEGLTEYDVLSKDKMMSIGTAALLSAKEYSDGTLATAKTYTDSAVSTKTQVKIVEENVSTPLETFQIYKMTQAQYDQELANGNIKDNALYMTPDEDIDLSGYATIDQLDEKSNVGHTHDEIYYTEDEIDDKLNIKADVSSIPTTLSALSGDSTHRVVTDAEKEIWNAKSDFSGDYNDLINKPAIPSVDGLVTKTYVDEQDTAMLAGANEYTDEKIALLMNNSSTAVDSIMELAVAMEVNEDVVNALNEAIGNKADAEHAHNDLYYGKSEVDAKLGNKSDTGHSHSDLYYTKTEFDSIELITPEEIDAICGVETSIDVVSLNEGVF